MTKYLAAVVFLTAMTAVASAQTDQGADQADDRFVIPFLGATFVGVQIGGGILEADIVPNHTIMENLQESLRRELRIQAEDARDPEFREAFALTAVPRVRLRMNTDEDSAPIRTPSYMPEVTFQLFSFGLVEPDKEEGFFSSDSYRLVFLSLQATVGHHSNGQTRCLFIDPDKERKCYTLPDTFSAQDVVDGEYLNKVDGSFSTNYLRFGAWGRIMDLGKTKPKKGEPITPSRERTFGFEVEFSPGQGNFLGGAGIDPELKRWYGATRLTGSIGQAWRDEAGCKRLEGKAALTYFHKRPTGSPRAWNLEANCLFSETGWGVSARYYMGQDYYNLGFLSDVKRFQVGVTYSQEGFMQITPGS